jgi:hypothetical protein
MKNILAFTFFILIAPSLARGFDVDFSRRQKRSPASQSASEQIQNTNSSREVPVSNYNNQPVPVAEPVAAPPTAQQLGQSIISSENTQSEAAADSKIPSRLDGLFKHAISPANGDRQEFVILNTSKGFIPSNVRLRKGLHYTVHIVNVNEDKKNISFMLDAFQQHHATYFGKIKSFDLDPNKEGIFEFQCPETATQGRIVVFGEQLKVERHLSSESQ